MTRSIPFKQFLLIAFVLTLVTLGPSQRLVAQTSETSAPATTYRFGVGVQGTGLACCISLREWVNDSQGLELTVNAQRLLYLTVRGLSKFGSTAFVDGYSGAGATFAFGPSPVRTFPLVAIQFFLGLGFNFPFLPPQLAVDLEGGVTLQLNEQFFTDFGGGIHFYF